MPKKSRKTKSKKQSKLPGRDKFFVGLLVVLIIAGIIAVKLSRTTRGLAFLLDHGFGNYYEQVQEEVDQELLSALHSVGLKKGFKERQERLDVNGRACYSKRWDITCGEDGDLLHINAVLTQAVRRLGIRVRKAVEADDGNLLTIEVGSKRYLTHKIIIRKSTKRIAGDVEPRPKLAILIDDFGYADNELIKAFLSFDLPLTISVIPSLPHSRHAAMLANKLGKEVLLHLPMEAAEPVRSDVDMVLTTMNDHDIRELVERYARELPHVAGANNHMGSRATQDVRVMKAVLSVLKRRGLFFLDSLTSGKSIAYNTAKSMGVGSARNDLFLDAETEDSSVVEKRIERLLSLAKRNGYAVGIGHPKQWTFEALERSITLIENSGVQLVFVSEIIDS
jgi:polysaccharide deacetylase 2 family uncharacterized protein YibQ